MCLYNPEWENSDQFSWVSKCNNDRTKARCNLCVATFTIASDGINALIHHGESQKHQRNVHVSVTSRRMDSFFVTKDSSQNEKVIVAELVNILSWSEAPYFF